ncbi:transcription initiation factor TFIID subunit A-domain-containing protein [Limtongia smithiae]|uniref:transcription initiation factor TFIID subunit A-domain-containing protein n=1 Tax=Limtongia smithiae TaxID=1125753 RepID=UPI0034CF868D
MSPSDAPTDACPRDFFRLEFVVDCPAGTVTRSCAEAPLKLQKAQATKRAANALPLPALDSLYQELAGILSETLGHRVFQLDPDVQDVLQDVAEEFVISVCTFASQLARHRRSSTLDVEDVKLHLEMNYGIRVALSRSAPTTLQPLRLMRKREPTESYLKKQVAVTAHRNLYALEINKAQATDNLEGRSKYHCS